MLRLTTPLSDIHSLGQRFLKHLERLGIRTVKDLLWHFPARYEDFSQIYNISDLEPGQQATIQGVVEEIDMRRSWRRGMAIVEALVSDKTGSIRVVWFNQPYIKSTLRPGRLANFAGKVSISENEIYLSHPTYELVNLRRKFGAPTQWTSEETRHTARLVPIYPETKGLTSKGFRFLIQPILKNVERIREWIPEDVLAGENLPEINHALRHIHFPEELDLALRAKKRFAFEDLFLLQLWNVSQKLKLAKERAPVIKTDLEGIKEILGTLPFALTVSQKKSLWEIIQDLEKSKPMNRLLQGDVGSGKTVVAALAALSTSKNEYQAAFLAPTEVLARQHFETLKNLFRRIPRTYQASIGFLTASASEIFYENDVEAKAKKQKLASEIKNGGLKIIVGTHALIQPRRLLGRGSDLAMRASEKTNGKLEFHNLGLVIVDEQHRFGVEQRAALLKQNQSAHHQFFPHFLSMSATPIPRTLMLTIFGDLDISTITELPSGRKNIVTKVVDPQNREKSYAFIREQVKAGRQAFVICPRIEAETSAEQESAPNNAERISVYQRYNQRKSASMFELKSVKEEYEKLSKKIFPDLRVAMLHGQLKAKEKEKIMADFKNKKIDILVSTSVIEVGVDVPNATVMMIEGSDRFGLAQLYQFRGRVGRGEHQSYCFLFTDSSAASTKARLKAILEAKNGFELAEKDLAIRGPGQFLGTEQTGLPDLAMQGLQDMELIRASRRAALRLIQESSSLANFPLLKKELAKFSSAIHRE